MRILEPEPIKETWRKKIKKNILGKRENYWETNYPAEISSNVYTTWEILSTIPDVHEGRI